MNKAKKKYALGLDFGTLSVRASLVDLEDGTEFGAAVNHYAHGVIERHLPNNQIKLKVDSALQNPLDYLESLEKVVPQVINDTGIDSEDVVGIGVDFTSCTMMPTSADGTPLCADRRFKDNPHAWAKLWKHHAAQPEADKINEIGNARKEPFIQIYGGKYSSEWFFSKLLETVNDAPDLYDASDTFIEAGDWIVWQLTGNDKRSISAAGFKSMVVYPSENGEWNYPPSDFFKELHPKLENVVSDKLADSFLPLGTNAGGLTKKMASILNLCEGTAVAVANIDAHVAVPACKVANPGKLVMIMGTSTCHLLVSNQRHMVEGMCGVVEDGVLPGFWGYEAGQSGVGDSFAWFLENAYPGKKSSDSDRESFEFLSQKAKELKVGQSGLLALDWWNGNRSVLMDSDLSGLIVGLSITSQPHEIFRALIEATAFGTRRIIEAFTNQGVDIDEIIACGGLAKKNPFLMQVYADITGRIIKIASSEQTCALGSAMFGALAAGHFNSIEEAAEKMAHLQNDTYSPNPKNMEVYQKLYHEYLKLHDYFGRQDDSPMKLLKNLRREMSGS